MNVRKSSDKVIASLIRKGNILEVEGKLYVVLTAENIHPGKGTPSARSKCAGSATVSKSPNAKTTDQVERAFVEDRDFNYSIRTATASIS
ncbi:MAG: hypothetical protein R3D69_13895 [Xanthobacteraceae bacterium]